MGRRLGRSSDSLGPPACLRYVGAMACSETSMTGRPAGLYGLLRMPDIFHQLHPAGLVTGPAVILVLLASAATGSAEIITSRARDPLRADHLAAVDPRDRAGGAPPAVRAGRPGRRPHGAPTARVLTNRRPKRLVDVVRRRSVRDLPGVAAGCPASVQ